MANKERNQYRREASLFREEVLDTKQTNWLGDVVLSSPLSFKLMGMFGICTLIAVALLGYFGTYTKKSQVTGQIGPAGGIARLFPQQAGVILEVRVQEGQRVSRGDILFVMTSEKTSSAGESQAVISRSIRERKSILSDEISRVLTVAKYDRTSLANRITAVRTQIAAINSMIAIQTKRVSVASDLAGRFRNLLREEFVSEADVQAREAELLDQQTRLTSLERDRADASGTLVNLETELAELPSKTETNMGTVQNQIQSASEDLSVSESKRILVVKAPISGIATAIIGHVGQAADLDRPLVSILPNGPKMEAELYASSKEIGFVHVGDEVNLRYEAYPYQMYGVYIGHVALISRTPLSPEEFKYIGELIMQRAAPEDRGSPLYRITVQLDSQLVTVNGRHEAIRPGMLFEADIIQETRRLYQWVLEPLYAYAQTPDHAPTANTQASSH